MQALMQVVIVALSLFTVYLLLKIKNIQNKLDKREEFIRRFVTQEVVDESLAKQAVVGDNFYKEEVGKIKTQEEPANLYQLESKLENTLYEIQIVKDEFTSLLKLACDINSDMRLGLNLKNIAIYQDYLPQPSNSKRVKKNEEQVSPAAVSPATEFLSIP